VWSAAAKRYMLSDKQEENLMLGNWRAFLDWCRQERDENQKFVDLLSSGSMKTGRNDGTGWRDTTNDDMEKSKRIVSNLNGLIAKIEKDNA